MAHRTSGRIVAASCVLAIAAIGLSGCGGSPQPAAPEAPAVDPRYATAEALVEHYNGCMTRPPRDLRTMKGLVYAENEIQRQALAIMDMMVVTQEFARAFEARFNEPWSRQLSESDKKADQPARLTRVDAQRADGEYVSGKGEKSKLMLVKVGDRWWISGYTYEYDPEFRKAFPQGDVAKAAAAVKLFVDVIANVHARMNNNEFATGQAVRMAALDGMIELARTHGEEIRSLNGMFGDDRK